MNTFRRITIAASLLLPLSALAAASVPASPQGTAAVSATPSPDSFHVFVDLPTGFMFVKTPYGWKFRGQLATDRYSQLPVGTYVSLLPAAQVSAPEVADGADRPLGNLAQR